MYLKEGTTRLEATREWVNSFNAIEHGMMEVLVEAQPEKWTEVTVGADEADYDGFLPCSGWMWSFGNSADDYWLEELGGIKIMSECGFRIYEHEEFGYFFGIEGYGYSYLHEHFLPLYNARGLQWHDPETDKEEQVA